jgi:type VI secretion system secreted protein Hcp
MAIYMQYGDKIKGSVTTDGFDKWIMLESFQWGVGRSVSTPHGSDDTREGSEPSVSEALVTMYMDKASPELWQDTVGGDFSSKVTIRFTTTSKDKVVSFLEYEFTDTGLSSYSVSSSNTGLPLESLTLNFAKVAWKYSALDAKTSGTPNSVGWDLTQQKKV